MNSACQSCVSVDGQSISAVRIEIGMQGTRRLKLALNHLNAFSFVLIFVLLLFFIVIILIISIHSTSP